MEMNQFRALMLILLMTVISWGAVSARPFIVKGIVTDVENGGAVADCSVVINGTQSGTITGTDGTHSIRANGGVILVFSLIGYRTQKIRVTSAHLDVALETDTQQSEECVVIGYEVGTQKMICGATPITMNRGLLYNVEMSAEEYRTVQENGFKGAWDNLLPTLSINVDVASYSNMRRFLNKGELPPANAIRIEELINYFSYNYVQLTRSDPIRITSEISTCPRSEQHRLVRIGLKTKEIPIENLPASNLIFLIDISGSMYDPGCLDLIKSSLKLLVNNLRNRNKVATVVCSGATGGKLASTPGSDKQKIRETIDELEAGGSITGGGGIKLAYKIAQRNFIIGDNNCITLCTDGDFNMGVSSGQGLKKLIGQRRKNGVFPTVLGYGMGNCKDSEMQTPAGKGDGNHAYIDNLQEANRVLVNEFGATLHMVAKGVKLQVEFSPAQVQAYRLTGYEGHLLADEDSNNDIKDAGEMGARRTVTVFYEATPIGVKGDFTGKTDDLKYQKKQKTAISVNDSDELLTAKLRYKTPDGDASEKIEQTLTGSKNNRVSADPRFAATVAVFGQLLKDSKFKGNANYGRVISLAEIGLENDEEGYKRELVRLAETAKGTWYCGSFPRYPYSKTPISTD